MTSTAALLRELPLAPYAAALGDGSTDLDSTLDEALARAATLEPTLRALLPEPARAARLRAEAAALGITAPEPGLRPPLWGVPVGIKDIIAVDGFETRAGSALPAEAFAMPEAAVVQRLRQAGALIFGKTVTAEFASYGPGPTTNPHSPVHTPGGSSSGSAAGVAAGYFPLAIGSQTGGSIIRPAAYCGIVGFKPSYGRIPLDGVVYHAPSVDTLGPFAQDVDGITLAASVLLEGWRAGVALDRLPVLAVPEGAYLDQVESAALAAFEASVARLEEGGIAVRRIPFLEDAAQVLERHVWLMQYEFREQHLERFARWGSLYTGVSAGLFDEAGRVTPAQHLAGVEGRIELRARVATLFASEGIDALIAPATLGPAPLGLRSTGAPTMNSPWTHAGVPAVTLPAGAVDGLPVGLQLVGRFEADEELLAVAAAVEPLV